MQQGGGENRGASSICVCVSTNITQAAASDGTGRAASPRFLAVKLVVELVSSLILPAPPFATVNCTLSRKSCN